MIVSTPAPPEVFVRKLLGSSKPKLGVKSTVTAEGESAVVESVKAASDIYSPVNGEVVEVNETLADAPETINSDPYGNGWIFKVRLNDEAELVEQGTICEPGYAVWGWSARPVKPRDDDAGWNEAITTLEANRREYW